MVGTHLALGERHRVFLLDAGIVRVDLELFHAETTHVAARILQAVVPAAHGREGTLAYHAHRIH
jgi:hypothetical protein